MPTPPDILQQHFDQYEDVRQSGDFNMITEASSAIAASGLTRTQYFYILENYSAIQAERHSIGNNSKIL